MQVEKEKLFNYFYKITNLNNGRYYHGIRSSNRLTEPYMGSGKAIKKAIKKYGKDNFKKEIIAHYPTRTEVLTHEKMIVTQEMINDPLCYNLKTGGDNACVFSDETIEKLKGRTGELNPFFGKTHTPEVKQAVSNAQKGKTWSDERKQSFAAFQTGKKHTEKSIQKMRDNKLGHEVSMETREKIRLANSRENSVWKNRKHTPETIERMIENSGVARKCLINGVVYNSLSDAGRCLGIDTRQVHKRINSKTDRFSNWQYFDEGNIL